MQTPADETTPVVLPSLAKRVPARITVFSGGVGGARFLRGLSELIAQREADAAVSVIANTGDDIWVHGLKVCPDLDTLMYTLGDGIDPERGWGRLDETFRAKEELSAYGVEPGWFGLGDRDLATHLVRTQMLDAGYSLTDVTHALCQRWQPGVRLLPMTDDRVETHVVITEPDSGEQKAVHFQEYWIKHRAEVPAHAVIPVGLAEATPTPQVLAAISEAELIIIPPSNPVVSIDPILDLPGIREALRAAAAPVVGVSGIINGNHVRGMARQLLSAIGVQCDPVAVAQHYGSRKDGDGILDGWLIAEEDAQLVQQVADLGIRAAAAPLWMSDPQATAEIASAAIELVG